ncbi:hypothetical protein PSE_0584 [Pseudovibrio sp. FO-BEG1]|nr:hypothetical protein PSE_0584 [Pseudovibrio sp. FO-BEG1]
MLKDVHAQLCRSSVSVVLLLLLASLNISRFCRIYSYRAAEIT